MKCYYKESKMKTLFLAIVMGLCLGFGIISCTTTPPAPKEVVFTIDGNVKEIIVVTEHPCEGNWNFCDQVRRRETLVIPGEDDIYGSYVYPEFKSNFMVHESVVK
jgi:hypothetical protein